MNLLMTAAWVVVLINLAAIQARCRLLAVLIQLLAWLRTAGGQRQSTAPQPTTEACRAPKCQKRGQAPLSPFLPPQQGCRLTVSCSPLAVLLSFSLPWHSRRQTMATEAEHDAAIIASMHAASPLQGSAPVDV